MGPKKKRVAERRLKSIIDKNSFVSNKVENQYHTFTMQKVIVKRGIEIFEAFGRMGQEFKQPLKVGNVRSFVKNQSMMGRQHDSRVLR